MITDHIIYYPNNQYNTRKELVKNLRVCDYINYGYIKLRDLDKWLNNEDVAVKMGMLTPSKDGYRNLSVVDAALKRIKEQDSTSCFEDGDELIPIYIFISEDMDFDWRDFLFSNGFNPTRTNASREGVRINKNALSIMYSKRYSIDTEESISERELKEQELKIKQDEQIKKIYEEKQKINTEFLSKYNEKYDVILKKQINLRNILRDNGDYDCVHLDTKTLIITAIEFSPTYKFVKNNFNNDNIILPLYVWGGSLCFIICLIALFLGCINFLTISSLIIFCPAFIIALILTIKEVFTNDANITIELPLGRKVEFLPNGEKIYIDDKSYNSYKHEIFINMG